MAGVFIVGGAMTGDEQRRFLGIWSAGSGISFDDVERAGEQYAGHAGVGADGAAVVKRLRPAPLGSEKIRPGIGAQAELARDNFFREVTFADEERHDKNAGSEYAPQ